MKLKKDKRSLVTLKRSDVSIKQKEIQDIVKMMIDDDIDIDEILPEENIPADALARYPSIQSIADELLVRAKGDIDHDAEIMDELLTKNQSHPQFPRLQITLVRTLSKALAPENRQELFDFITDQNAADLDPDDDLDAKISETAGLFRSGRKTKAVKSILACIRRIENKRTPHEFHKRPVLSIFTLLHEKLYRSIYQTDDQANFYQTPAAYDTAYQMHAEHMHDEGNYAEAFESFCSALEWNPVNASAHLFKANILTQLGCAARAVEVLKEAYPCIEDTSQLLHLYIEYSAILLSENEADPETAALAIRLYHLSKYLIPKENSDRMIEIAEVLANDFVGGPVEPIPREEFIRQLEARDIPFGASQTTIDAYREAIKDAPDDETRKSLEKDLDALVGCLDGLKEI